ARNLRDPAGGRRSKSSENPSKPEFTPVNAARGTSRHRRRNDRVRDSVKAWTVSLRCAAVSETQETAALRDFDAVYVRFGHLRPRRSKPDDRLCPLRSKSGQTAELSTCPLSAIRWGNRPISLWIAEEIGCCASG